MILQLKEQQVKLSARLCDEIPALAHARGQGLLAHRVCLNPSSCRWASVFENDVFGVIASNAKLMNVHGEPYVREDMDQWWISGEMNRFAHITLAKTEA
jgi:hypothetical protein